MEVIQERGRECSVTCDVCGNDYDRGLEVTYLGGTYRFDSLECAIHALAPICGHCGCRVIGHGIEAEDTIFCCAHCAARGGIRRVGDNA